MLQQNLNAAKAAKNDEFYTRLEDIENELRHYRHHFKDKVVFCNCDDPRVSKFFHFFSYNFEFLGLRKLVTTCYKNQNPDLFSRHDSEQAIKLEYNGFRDGDRVPKAEDIGIIPLEGDGDFRSAECVELLRQVDIVVTNPPFSLFREYVAQLMEHDKKFLIIGNKNAITYKEVFPLIRDNKLWLGINPMGQDMLFDIPSDHIEELLATKKEGSAYRVVDGVIKRRLGNAAWFTNLVHARRNEELILFRPYTPDAYPAYDNYDAIEVSRIVDIPADYDGAMGVPITFLDRYNPDQFEILGSSRTLGRRMSEVAEKGAYQQGGPRFYLSNGDGTYRRLYDRIVIKRRQK